MIDPLLLLQSHKIIACMSGSILSHQTHEDLVCIVENHVEISEGQHWGPLVEPSSEDPDPPRGALETAVIS